MTISQISSGGGVFALDAPASASNRTIVLPDASTTLVGTDATQTLTNKTIPIVGVTDGSSASAGIVGEYVESDVAATATGLTSTVASAITSISLTAGDWDVNASIDVNPAGSTSVSYINAAISLTTSLPSNGNDISSHVFSSSTVPSTNPRIVAPMKRISIASTTTVYLLVRAAFTVSTCGAGGRISARRVR